MKLQKKAPTTFGDVYCQNWVAGVQGGGSGTNIFIEIKDENIVLDSVHFRGKTVKLETKPANPQLFIGRLKSEGNTNQYEVVSTSDQKEQMEDFPFRLENDECVVSYKENGKIKYFKLIDIKEKPIEALPLSAPSNKN
ncbi:hypothetical protein [Winogradskyella jejuensis]|nr:hypothetical protein [Winogradskyella jejuensis]